MRHNKLPTVHGFIGNGQRIRVEMAKAISTVEVYTGRGQVVSPASAKLQALFQAGIDRLKAVDASVAPPPAPPAGP